MTEKPVNTMDLHDCEPEAETMRDDVFRGLSRVPKRLPSQYLYDRRGARLFEQICETPEYYLTRTEIAIMRDCMAEIARRVGPDALILEPGSGSGVKTRMLLAGLEAPTGYVPIDVARDQLVDFSSRIREEFPAIDVTPVCADFTSDYALPACGTPTGRRITFFPGSTIGNFTPDAAVGVLRHTAELCGEDGGVLIGVDLKKDRAILEPAYDDAAGVSRDFALNYLVRLNRELDADFAIERFTYEAPYNEEEGRIEMALVSRCDQVVRVDGAAVALEADERVGTEYSYKYTVEEFVELSGNAGLQVTDVWTDPDQLFSVQYLRPA